MRISLFMSKALNSGLADSQVEINQLQPYGS